jgi:phosphoribosylformimino-5-aminoimidazole carboxamide ribotide isomerase
VEGGARRLHVVDLDGARDGAPANMAHLARIASELGVPVQYGGGLRSKPDVDAALDAGAARIVLGTAAFRDEGLLDDSIAAHGERVAVGVDVREGRVAVHGWQERTELTAGNAVEQLVGRGVRTIVYTNVDADGMLEGANLAAAHEIAAAAGGARVIFSGGIGTLDDLRGLSELDLDGVIVGKALYEGRFTVEEALAVL